MLQKIQDYCQTRPLQSISKTGSSDQPLIGGLQYYELDSKYNNQTLRRQLLITPEVNESAVILHAFYDEYEENSTKGSNKDIALKIKIPYNKFTFVFRYNQDYGIFGCPLFCTIKTNLIRIDILQIAANVEYDPSVCP